MEIELVSLLSTVTEHKQQAQQLKKQFEQLKAKIETEKYSIDLNYDVEKLNDIEITQKLEMIYIEKKRLIEISLSLNRVIEMYKSILELQKENKERRKRIDEEEKRLINIINQRISNAQLGLKQFKTDYMTQSTVPNINLQNSSPSDETKEMKSTSKSSSKSMISKERSKENMSERINEKGKELRDSKQMKDNREYKSHKDYDNYRKTERMSDKNNERNREKNDKYKHRELLQRNEYQIYEKEQYYDRERERQREREREKDYEYQKERYQLHKHNQNNSNSSLLSSNINNNYNQTSRNDFDLYHKKHQKDFQNENSSEYQLKLSSNHRHKSNAENSISSLFNNNNNINNNSSNSLEPFSSSKPTQFQQQTIQFPYGKQEDNDLNHSQSPSTFPFNTSTQLNHFNNFNKSTSSKMQTKKLSLNLFDNDNSSENEKFHYGTYNFRLRKKDLSDDGIVDQMTGIPKVTTSLDYYDQRKDINACGKIIEKVITEQDNLIERNSSILLNHFKFQNMFVIYDSIIDGLSNRSLNETIDKQNNIIGFVFNNCTKVFGFVVKSTIKIGKAIDDDQFTLFTIEQENENTNHNKINFYQINKEKYDGKEVFYIPSNENEKSNCLIKIANCIELLITDNSLGKVKISRTINELFIGSKPFTLSSNTSCDIFDRLYLLQFRDNSLN